MTYALPYTGLGIIYPLLLSGGLLATLAGRWLISLSKRRSK